MSENNLSFPYEASDNPPKRRHFNPESLKPEEERPELPFLEDPGEQTGTPGELGGGYLSLEKGTLKPSEIDANLGPDWKLTPHQKRIGKEGVKRARQVLKETVKKQQDNSNMTPQQNLPD